MWGVSCLALVAVWQFMLRPTLVDYYRADLFKLRRRLFLFMASGKISSSNPAYKDLRKGINSLLRFAERVTFLRLIVTALFARQNGRQLVARRTKLIAAAPNSEARQYLALVDEQIAVTTLIHLIRTSPLVLLVALAYLADWAERIARQVAMRATVRSVEAEAVSLRSAMRTSGANLHQLAA
jgi:hypothetical protein